MSPPAVSVGFRPPSENGPTVEAAGTHAAYSCSFNTGSSSSSMGRASSVRPKPRLVKQRRSSKTTSSFSASVDAGINPFRSVSSETVDDVALNCSNNYSQFENVGFVFGGFNLSNKVDDVNNNNNNNVVKEADFFGVRSSGNSDLLNKVGNFNEGGKKECSSTDGVGVSFSGTDKDQIGVSSVISGGDKAEFEVLDGLKKLNIEKGRCVAEENGHGLNRGDVLKGGDGFFVFKTGGGVSDVCGGSSMPFKSDVCGANLNGDGKGVNDGKMGGFGSQYVDDSVFVFGNSGKFSKIGDCSSQSSVFTAENDGARGKEDLVSSSFSFSSLDAEAGNAKPEACSSSGERKVEFSSSGLPERCEASFSDFKLPNFDAPLSFSANLVSDLGRKQESNLRTRGLKDRNLKKTKGKLKQSKHTKLQPGQNPSSSEGLTGGQEASECYSPMDFSPYEDTTNDDIPLSGAKVTNGNSSAVQTESQLNDSDACISSKLNSTGGDAVRPSFSSDKASRCEEKFTFTSSSSAQNNVSSPKRLQRRKYRMKAAISVSPSMVPGSSLDNNPLLSKLQGVAGNISASKDKHDTEAGEELVCEEFSSAEKACEKWRRRGNGAYEKGELSKAEDFYTWGVNCIPPGDASGVAFKPLVRCYSNRAATRMALGRLREAIQDCLMAVKLDPTFFRAHIRAANCYLQLGEVEEAMQCFGKCMSSGNALCLDRKLVISASDGIQKSQKVVEFISRSAELLKLRTSEAAAEALQYIIEAMSTSIYSEKLIEMKAQALCILSKHEEAITLCQKTLDFAEKNSTAVAPGNHEVDAFSSYIKMWRYRTKLKCHFHLGNLEVARDLLEKQEFRNKKQELSDPLAIMIHELLKQKSAGNTAFNSGKHAEAVEHYTSAILSNIESRPFAAICFCNRAAAHQALGQMTDAISDCSLAIALDENYAKAVSRRATLHEMIRDYRQAASDLQRLLSLLQKQSLEKSRQSGSGNGKEIRQVQQRLSLMEEEAKREVPLDLYLILGIKKTDTVSEIKKAYRKAALRHHPDKAAQSLVKAGEMGEEGRYWKDIAELVYKDSDRLFKMIGEAYAVLSDPTKREEYDDGEDLRKVLKETNNMRTNSRSQGYPFERSSTRRYWQDNYKTYYPHRR